jgi:hypothetical protein
MIPAAYASDVRNKVADKSLHWGREPPRLRKRGSSPTRSRPRSGAISRPRSPPR